MVYRGTGNWKICVHIYSKQHRSNLKHVRASQIVNCDLFIYSQSSLNTTVIIHTHDKLWPLRLSRKLDGTQR